MAKDDLTGNMPTEKLLSYFTANKENTNLNPLSFESAYNEASNCLESFIRAVEFHFVAIVYK
jgi:hydroxymethylglutaryl-CoA lyase